MSSRLQLVALILLSVVGMLAPCGGQAAAPDGRPAEVVDLAAWPGVLRGEGLTEQQRLQNGVAMQQAFDHADEKGAVVRATAGVYEYIATGSQGPIRVGLHLRHRARGFLGAAGMGARLVQYAVGYPALTLGDLGPDPSALTLGARYEDIRLGFGMDQAGQESGIGLQLGRIWGSYLNNIFVDPYASGAHRADAEIGISIPPIEKGFFFSNVLPNVVILSGRKNFLRHTPTSSTGNAWGSLYLGGGTFGDYRDLSGPALYVAGGAHFGHVAQLNIEWVRTPQSARAQLMFIDDCPQFAAAAVHFEGNVLRGDSPRLMQASASRLNIGSLSLLDNAILAGEVSGKPSIFGAYGASDVAVQSGQWKWNGGGQGDGLATHDFWLFVQDGEPGPRSRVGVRNTALFGNSGALSGDDTLLAADFGSVRSFEAYHYDPGQSEMIRPRVALREGQSRLQVFGAFWRAQVALDAPLASDVEIVWSDMRAPSGVGAAMPGAPDDTLEVWRTSAATGDHRVTIRRAASAEPAAAIAEPSQLRRLGRR